MGAKRNTSDLWAQAASQASSQTLSRVVWLCTQLWGLQVTSIREHLHNDSIQEESPFVPYRMTEKSNLVGEVIISVENVLRSAIELLRDELLAPYVNDDFSTPTQSMITQGGSFGRPTCFLVGLVS